MLRRCLERLARHRVIKRALPVDFDRVKLFISPDAQLKYLKLGRNAFDADLLQIAIDCLHPNDNVWDIGANVGVFTFAAASRVKQSGKVLAVEADIWLADLIQRSVDINKNYGCNITVLPAAISSQVGIATFMIAARGRASNALQAVGGNHDIGGIRKTVTVATLTLDILLEQTFAPQFIKIDVEGAERLVLDGATKLLKEIRPLIYVEVNGNNVDAVSDILKQNNYRLVDGLTRQPLKCCSFNTLALPRS